MAKAVVPMSAFRDKFALTSTEEISGKLQDMVAQFLRDAASSERKKEPVRS